MLESKEFIHQLKHSISDVLQIQCCVNLRRNLLYYFNLLSLSFKFLV